MSTSPQSLEDLIPYVADVIEHAMSLQKEAEVSVDRVKAAAAAVSEATRGLASTHGQLATEIERKVGARFDTAVKEAGERIGTQLTLAEQQAKKALGELAAATQTSATAIRAEAERVHANWWWPMMTGGVIGLALGVMGAWLWLGGPNKG